MLGEAGAPLASGGRGARRCSAAFPSHSSPPVNLSEEKRSAVISGWGSLELAVPPNAFDLGGR